MADKILATDLDGTLIPLDDRSDNVQDLKKLEQLLDRMEAMLVFVTGRHYASVLDAITQFDLPTPDWIICDVGTSIYRKVVDKNYELVKEYAEHQAQIISNFTRDELLALLSSHAELRVQEAVKQGPFKLSFYVEQDRLESLSLQLEEAISASNAPWSIISSVDPFNGDGLIDFLPKSVSKAHALSWWTEFTRLDADAIVFAGDSGNDLAALTAGYKSIVVGNASRTLREKVLAIHQKIGLHERICLSRRHATSGVLDGCMKFWA